MQVRNVTVVGAGNMGSGIAQAFASAGFNVTLNDVSADAVARGLERIRKPLGKRVAEGKMKQAELDALTACLTPQADLAAAVAQADLVVEAVFEDLTVKRDLFARLDKLAPAKTLLATNTSSFYVKDLAAVTQRPAQVVGLHFFFPAAINKLVEVVKGPGTSEEAFAATYAAVKRSGKVPIQTADAPGFAVNRFFVPWVNEACRLLDEGHALPLIEATAKSAFGLGMGPFELMNVTGVPISLHAQSTLHRELGAFYEPAPRLVAQVAAKADWDLGTPDEQAKAAGEAKPGQESRAAKAIASRLRGVTFGISCHLVDEGVATQRDTDRGATIGLRWERGPFAMMNKLGIATAAKDVQALADKWGKPFPMPKALADHASAGKPWHLPTVVHEFLDGNRLATITFDRPEALNALAPPVLADLEACVLAIAATPTVRAVVVTGEGKAFVAGADIPTMRAMDPAGAARYTDQGHRVLERLAGLPCPVVMAVNGFAFGGGLELALAGDLLVASDKAQLGLPEVSLGIHPGFGGLARLPRRVGIGAAKDLVFTGRTVDAAEAKAMGLVDAVVPAAQLMDHCLELARRIADKAPLAVAAAKRAMDQGTGTDLGSALRIERESVILLFSTKDKQEGLDAFVERRPAKFVGK